jgi:guanylate kinase
VDQKSIDFKTEGEGKVYFCVPQEKFQANFGNISKDTFIEFVVFFGCEAKKKNDQEMQNAMSSMVRLS